MIGEWIKYLFIIVIITCAWLIFVGKDLSMQAIIKYSYVCGLIQKKYFAQMSNR
jgi:hypothetical protein